MISAAKARECIEKDKNYQEISTLIMFDLVKAHLNSMLRMSTQKILLYSSDHNNAHKITGDVAVLLEKELALRGYSYRFYKSSLSVDLIDVIFSPYEIPREELTYENYVSYYKKAH